MSFNYCLPVNLFFGSGQIHALGEQTAPLGKRPLLVVGKNSARQSGLLDLASELLRKSGARPVIFDEVTPNPLTTVAAAGATIARAQGCDAVVGIGGGSIMDAAKGIALMARNDGDITDYMQGLAPPHAALPLVLVPTTCGTGSEGNAIAVFTNPDTLDKKSIRSPHILPRVSIVDPALMMSMPKALLASVGLDAFCHSMEAYLSNAAQPLTDLQAVEGMRLIADALPRLFAGTGDMRDWERMALASTMGGMVIHMAGVTAGHALEHPISGLTDIAHGLGLAAITPAILRRTKPNAPAAMERLAVVSRILHGTGADDCGDAFASFARLLGLECRLSDFGVTAKNVEWLTENCLRISAAGLARHPVVFGGAEIMALYQEAL